MTTWEWDQGRFDYFRFDNIQNIARVLASLDGIQVSGTGTDLLRADLERETGLLFKPQSAQYKVWRNYGRVFQCTLLGAKVNNRLVVTDVCRMLAVADVTRMEVDDYLGHLVPRFSFPFPAFDSYTNIVQRQYFFCATLKYLYVALLAGQESSMSLRDIIDLIVGNDCTGLEDLDFYSNLEPAHAIVNEDEIRQLRESLIFISQSSFLKWHENRLYIDVLPGDAESLAALNTLINPVPVGDGGTRSEEILLRGRLGEESTNLPDVTRRQPADVIFTEGSRTRVTHLRIERSPYLRQWYFSSLPRPYICDMCLSNPRNQYPWTDNILEIHHLLPLASTFRVNREDGTSLNDVVALCPNCHKSVHMYYKAYLNNNSLQDFRNRDEAAIIYREAKGSIVV